jgi:hypothetical protein
MGLGKGMRCFGEEGVLDRAIRSEVIDLIYRDRTEGICNLLRGLGGQRGEYR